MNPNLSITKGDHLHFIGLNGSGMAPLAMMAHELGYKVSGCDTGKSYHQALLAKEEIDCLTGHSPDHLQGVNAIVFSTAISQSLNPEVVAAKGLSLPFFHRSDLLNLFLSKAKTAITVSGSHGKTTTSALMVYLLEKLGLSPSGVLGANLLGIDLPFCYGKGPYFVAEADESDGSFLKYLPQVAIMTNIDKDHLDFYKNLDGLEQAFLHHANSTSDFCVLNGDDERLKKIRQKTKAKCLTFGFGQDNDFKASDIALVQHEMTFIVSTQDKRVPVRLSALGGHNVLNALACLAVCSGLGLDWQEAASFLNSFPGVSRRLEVKAKTSTFTLIDDYAHNPGKIAASIKAVKEAYPKQPLLVVFEPHRYSRVSTLYQEFVQSFNLADEVFVLPIYAASELPDPRYTSQNLALDIKKNSRTNSFYTESFSDLLQALKKTIATNPVILTIGAGDIATISAELTKALV